MISFHEGRPAAAGFAALVAAALGLVAALALVAVGFFAVGAFLVRVGLVGVEAAGASTEAATVATGADMVSRLGLGFEGKEKDERPAYLYLSYDRVAVLNFILC
jgi:hypothetical protein